MGILKRGGMKIRSQDLYNEKFVTAEITDSQNQLHFHQIKYLLSDRYFFVTIKGKIYLFEFVPIRMKFYHHFGVQTFRVMHYNTDHFRPVADVEFRELEIFQKENNIGKIDDNMSNVMLLLGKKEKNPEEGKPFEPIKLSSILSDLNELAPTHPEKVQAFLEYLIRVGLTKESEIVTPVRRLSEFLHDDLKTTDPAWADAVLTQGKKTFTEKQKMTNGEITGKKSWLKWGILLGVIAVIAVFVGYVALSGGFDHLLSNPFGSILPPTPGQPLDKNTPISTWASTYPTPETLKAGIAKGEITCSNMPGIVKQQANTLTPHPCP